MQVYIQHNNILYLVKLLSRQGNNQVLNVLFIGAYICTVNSTSAIILYRDAVKQRAEYQSIIVSAMTRYPKYCR